MMNKIGLIYKYSLINKKMSSTLELQLNTTSYKSSSMFSKLIDSKDTTIEDLLNDEDFLSEVKIQNEVLFNYMDNEKVSQMIDILLTEPSLSNTNIKSFKIPFIICEALCLDINHFTDKLLDKESNYELFLKLIGYFKRGNNNQLLAGQDEPKQVESSGMGDFNLPFDDDTGIEQTTAWYVSKIITFLWLKRPDQVVDWISKNLHIIETLSHHIYLTEWISDILVKFVCLRITDPAVSLDKLKDIQKEILSIIIRIIDESPSDADKLDQAFETIKSISRRWYLVYNNRSFFSNWFSSEYIEDLMGESFFERLLKFIFNNTNKELNKSVLKCIESIHTTINNLFISSPIESDQDVAEYQFGFIVQSIAGKSIEEIKQEIKDTNMEDESNETPDQEMEPQNNTSKILSLLLTLWYLILHMNC